MLRQKKATIFTRRQLERDEGYPVGPGIMLRVPKEGRAKRLRGRRARYVAKVLTASSTEGETRPLANRVKTSQLRVHSRPSLSRSTERHSRIKTDYIPMSNGDIYRPDRWR